MLGMDVPTEGGTGGDVFGKALSNFSSKNSVSNHSPYSYQSIHLSVTDGNDIPDRYFDDILTLCTPTP